MERDSTANFIGEIKLKYRPFKKQPKAFCISETAKLFGIKAFDETDQFLCIKFNQLTW
jgi:hypothetical protein